MGEHSGYDRIFDNILNNNDIEIDQISVNRTKNVLSKFIDIFTSPFLNKIKYNGSYYYDHHLVSAELRLLANQLLNKHDLTHITFVERNYCLLQKLNTKLNIIGTVHQPPGWWKMIHQNPEIVSSFKSLIVLSNEQKEYFQQYLPGKTFFIRHAVDTNFFQPRKEETIIKKLDNPRLVFCGTWLRDFETLSIIIDQLSEAHINISVDLIIPNLSGKHGNPVFHKIARHSNVKWHSNLNDLDLLDIYQNASLLVLPLVDCAANNALVEAISCGLPVVCNDIGGVSDYTNNKFANIIHTGKEYEFANSISEIIKNKDSYVSRCKAARSYAIENLSLEVILKKTLEIYKNIIFN